MTYQVSSRADQDIEAIISHIAFVQGSLQNADLVLTRLEAQFAKLARLPSLGHVREELSDDHARVISVTGLLVLYDPFLEPLTILRVIHASRDLAKVKTRGR